MNWGQGSQINLATAPQARIRTKEHDCLTELPNGAGIGTQHICSCGRRYKLCRDYGAYYEPVRAWKRVLTRWFL